MILTICYYCREIGCNAHAFATSYQAGSIMGSNDICEECFEAIGEVMKTKSQPIDNDNHCCCNCCGKSLKDVLFYIEITVPDSFIEYNICELCHIGLEEEVNRKVRGKPPT